MSWTYLAFCCYFCRTNLAVFLNFCRTYLALSDTSCVFFNHFCRTYLALSDISCFLLQFVSDISSSVGHILRLFVIFVGHIWLRTQLALSDISSRNRPYIKDRGLRPYTRVGLIADATFR